MGTVCRNRQSKRNKVLRFHSVFACVVFNAVLVAKRWQGNDQTSLQTALGRSFFFCSAESAEGEVHHANVARTASHTTLLQKRDQSRLRRRRLFTSPVEVVDYGTAATSDWSTLCMSSDGDDNWKTGGHNESPSLDALLSLDDLSKAFVLGEGEWKDYTPIVYDATGAFEGAESYIYNGFQIRPIYFKSLPHKQNYPTYKKCTLVFAWLSTPLVDVSNAPSSWNDKQVPGVVLLHGGGGTADKRWCERWADEGFATIAMGLEGQTSYDTLSSQRDLNVEGPKWPEYKSTHVPGPKRPPSPYGDYKKELQDQWMFHAVATSMLANNILRNEVTVDASHVGVAGCSWGGVVATTLLPLEKKRYAFAIIGYGTGSLTLDDSAAAVTESVIGHELRTNGLERKQRYEEFWDPSPRLSHVKVPTLWLLSPTDVHFSLKAQRATYESLHRHAPKWISNIYGLKHGPSDLFLRHENYLFAKAVIANIASQQKAMTDTFHDALERKFNPRRVLLPGKVLKDHGILQNDDHLYSVSFHLVGPLTKASLIYSFEDPRSIVGRKDGDTRTWYEHIVELPSTPSEILSLPADRVGQLSHLDETENVLDYKIRSKTSSDDAFEHFFGIRRLACNENVAMPLRDDAVVPNEQRACFWSVTVALPPGVQSWYINAYMKDPSAKQPGDSLDYIVSGPYNDKDGSF